MYWLLGQTAWKTIVRKFTERSLEVTEYIPASLGGAIHLSEECELRSCSIRGEEEVHGSLQ